MIEGKIKGKPPCSDLRGGFLHFLPECDRNAFESILEYNKLWFVETKIRHNKPKFVLQPTEVYNAVFASAEQLKAYIWVIVETAPEVRSR